MRAQINAVAYDTDGKITLSHKSGTQSLFTACHLGKLASEKRLTPLKINSRNNLSGEGFKRTFSHAFAISGTGSLSECAQGNIAITYSDDLVLLLMTGSSASSLSLMKINSDGLAGVFVLPCLEKWHLVSIILRENMNEKTMAIEITDSGNDLGEWVAIAIPKYYVTLIPP